MAEKKQDTLMRLLNETFLRITSSEAELSQFLSFIGNVYKYPFIQQVLIYAQRPDATAVAPMNVWNERVGRRIQRGSKAIAVLDAHFDKVVNLFDISDTYGPIETIPYLWEFQNDHIGPVLKAFEVVTQNPPAYMLQRVLLDKIALTGLPETGMSCVYQAVCARIGMDTAPFLGQLNFKEFIYVSSEIQNILRTIEQAVKYFERSNHHEQLNLYGEGRPVVPEPDRGITDGESREVRDDRSQIPSGGEVQPVSGVDVREQTEWLPEEAGRALQDPSGTTDGEHAEESTHSGERRISEQSTVPNPNIPTGRGNHSGTADRGTRSSVKHSTPFKPDTMIAQPSLFDRGFDVTENTVYFAEPTFALAEINEEISQYEQAFDSGQILSSGQGEDWDALEQERDRILREPPKIKETDQAEPVAQPVKPSGQRPAKAQPEVQIAGMNYRIPSDFSVPNGQKSKYQCNAAAIKLLKELEAGGVTASLEQQHVLAHYVGWGGLPQAFDPKNESWSKEYAELKELLTEEEYIAARHSTLNAFYTSPVVIRSMYQALMNFGFNGGNLLEPAMAVGNFFGMLPDGLTTSKLYGVELDSISGRIAKHLYPNADIHIQGFEDTQFKDSVFDVVIGNVPFGGYKLYDKRYDRYNFLIHDYFFAKALDLVRPGGVIAFVTSKGTLDKQDSSVREYIARRAELVGAIRLPNNAFLQNANTGVTTDIIFLKRHETLYTGDLPSWVFLGNTADGVPVNQYYAEHPDMLLGVMAYDDMMYGSDKDTTMRPFEGKDLESQLTEAISKLHCTMRAVKSTEEVTLPAPPDVKNYSFTVQDGNLYYRQGSELIKKAMPKTTEARIVGMVKIKEELLNVIFEQEHGCSDVELQETQKSLNDVYDRFVKAYGAVNQQANKRAFSDDVNLPLLLAIERGTEQNQYEKSDIFFKRTIRPNLTSQSADSADDALMLSINYRNRVDLGYMQRLYPKTEEEIIQELGSRVYLNPARTSTEDSAAGWETAEEYLSGNVLAKLKIAEAAAQTDAQYIRNVEALKVVQPTPLTASEIDVRMGVTWIPESDYNDFLYSLLKTPMYLKGSNENRHIYIRYNTHTAEWTVNNKHADGMNVLAKSRYGTSRISAYDIIEETLNLKSAQVKDRDEDEHGNVRYVLNPKETILARERQELIKERFKSWLFEDQNRRTRLVEYYNEHFNNMRLREYDGSNLILPGINPGIGLYDHQKNAVARIKSGQNTLLAHVVGAGKTYSMIAGAKEQLRVGLAAKVAFVVPNHLTEQFGADCLLLYPSFKVLIASQKDFERQNRQTFLSKIATGDIEAVVMGHTQFEKIMMSPDYQRRAIQEELDEIAVAIDDMKEDKEGRSYTVKQMEKLRAGLSEQLKSLNDTTQKDDLLTFEQLGINSLFVDEAHYYKNCAIFSKMRNVAGISNARAKKSSDMLMKCRYLSEIGGSVTFATGTPISNSMAETYVMQRYLQNDDLLEMGIRHFDEWAAQFGETVTSMEVAPEGNGYRPRTRFAKFYNMPELMTVFRKVADIRTSDMLDLKTPRIAGGKPAVVVCTPSNELLLFIKQSIPRVQAIRDGSINPTEDNMLKFTSDARKAGTDMRLIDPEFEYDLNGKVAQCVEKVFKHYVETAEDSGVQVIFSDFSAPNGSFNIPDELRVRLVERGISVEQICTIWDTDNPVKREEMFEQLRSGAKRILIGSTQKCGAGTNIQKRLIALHHIDCPYRPSDIEQREGRILRQGNDYSEVYIYRYVTEKSFDSYLWQIVEQKQRFISQIMTSKSPSRTCEDVDEAVLSFAEVKAIASGDPRIKEKMEVDAELARLQTVQSGYRQQKYALQDDINLRYPNAIARSQANINLLEADIKIAKENASEEFKITIHGNLYTERDKAGELIRAVCAGVLGEDRQFGSYGGFSLYASKKDMFDKTKVLLKGAGIHEAEVSEDNVGTVRRIENVVQGLSKALEYEKGNLEQLNKSLSEAKEQFEQPFEYAERIDALIKRRTELTYELDLNNKDELVSEDTPEAGKPAVVDLPVSKQNMPPVMM